MNNSFSTGTGPPPLIDKETADRIVSIFSVFTLGLTATSVFLNATNITVFSRMGSLDSITVCLLFLAICDFLCMIALSTFSTLQCFSSHGFPLPVNTAAYSLTCATAFSLLISLASTSTTFIALQRGLALTFPFTARHLFNRNKALIFLVTITVFHCSIWTFRITFFRLEPRLHPRLNETVLAIVKLESATRLYRIYILTSKFIISFTEYFIMIICSILIFKGMRSSMQLKATATMETTDVASATTPEQSADAGKGETIHKDNKTMDENKKKPMDKKTARREYLVIKQTFLVVVCQIAGTTPSKLAMMMMEFNPRIDSNLNFVVHSGTYIFYGLNAIANFFIYFNYNTKFRTVLKSICCGKKA